MWNLTVELLCSCCAPLGGKDGEIIGQICILQSTMNYCVSVVLFIIFFQVIKGCHGIALTLTSTSCCLYRDLTEE